MGALDFLFAVAVILIILWLLRLFHLQPWHHHMGTACHSRHHNIGPAAFRAQSITYAKILPEIVNKKMVELGGVINYARTKNRR